MKKLLSILSITGFLVACGGPEGIIIKGDESYDALSKRVILKDKYPRSLIYEYTEPVNAISGIDLKNIPITYGQYKFSKKTGMLCDIQLFIPKESNRNLMISRINQDKRFNFIDTGDTFQFTRRMIWKSDEIDLLQTSVVNSGESILEIMYNRPDCD